MEDKGLLPCPHLLLSVSCGAGRRRGLPVFLSYKEGKLSQEVTLHTETFSQKAVEELSWLKNEPEWMRKKRLDAWHLFTRMPLPRWERTDISRLQLDALSPFARPEAETDYRTALAQASHTLLGLEEQQGGMLLQHDSEVVYKSLAEDLRRQGVIFTDLDSAVQDYPELVQKYFMSECVTPDSGKFAALHAAFWSGGLLLYVPKQTEITLPLQAYFSLGTSQLGLFQHTLIITEPGSQITLLEEYTSPSLPGQALNAGVTEILVGPEVNLTYVSLQNWGTNVYHLATQKALLERDSNFTWIFGTVGGHLSKIDIETLLQGPGATIELMGFFLTGEGQHFAFNTVQNHIAPYTTSDLLCKGALSGKSRSVFEGLIRVHKGAQHINAYQTNPNLLLNDKARADSLPTLEIEANDVRCTHGATVGRLEEELIFYLMSRGLSRREAEKLLVYGFFEPVLQRIPLENVRRSLEETIERKIEK
ncbi:MAG: Fe-S cluster assembly protein SufB [Nitrospinota bacterium]|nr:MAG: Fe-S cluster assembly protein SufB [Nitrospinota bacterium]